MKTVYLTLLMVLLASCATTHTGFVETTGDGHVYYEERGRGEPLLLLHGHSLDRRMWDEQWKPFAKNYRTIRLDFRGYGRSSEQHEDLQMTHADDVITLMDSLHIQRAHVVGLSMGAFVAGDLLAMHPERLLSCTMASGGIRNSKGPSEPMDAAERAKRDAEIAALHEKGIDQMKAEWIETLMNSGGSQRERMRKPLTQMITDWTAWQPQHKDVRLFYGREAWARLRERGKVNVPVLMIRGANEIKGKRNAPAELKHTTDGRFVVVEDCGHMLNMEQPQAFNQTVLEFINDNTKRDDY